MIVDYWLNYEDFIIFPSKVNNNNNNKILGFDLDGTIVSYKNCQSPKRLDTDQYNYQFLDLNMKDKIKHFSNEYNIVIITNQLNIKRDKLLFIQNIWIELECIPYIFIAHKKNIYRKPNITSIQILQQIFNLQVDIKKSFYCGDAIGLTSDYPPYQWNNTDLLYCNNCGFNFIIPYQLFSFPYEIATSNFVIMMGNQGSGKTTYALNLEKNYSYRRFSQDEYGTLLNRYNEISHLLLNGINIVIDATFPSTEKRYPWVNLCVSLNKTITIVWCIRDGRPFNSKRNKPVPEIAYSQYAKNFNDPQYDVLNSYYKIIKILI